MRTSSGSKAFGPDDNMNAKMQHRQVMLRGGWLFERSLGQTLATQLNTDRQVTLTGELDHIMWTRPEGMKAWVGIFPQLEAPVTACGQPALAATVGNLLRGAGWGVLFIELTGRCNERCVHCYAGSSPDIETALSRAQILGTISEAAQLGFTTVQLTGGDPLLSPHVVEAAQHARGVGIAHVEVYTNGLALRPKTARELADCGAKMALSVYSHRPAIHDAITQNPGSLSRTLAAIRLAIDVGIDVRVGVVLRQENLHDAESIRAALGELGVPPDRVGVDRERPVGRGTWHEDGSVPTGALDQGVHSSLRYTPGAGKLAVTYSAQVVPCIFDRSTVLGHLHGSGGITQVLERSLDIGASVTPRLELVAQPLACVDCRARRELLQRAHPPA